MTFRNIFTVAFILSSASIARADDVDAALAKLRVFKTGDGTQALSESLAVIRTKGVPGDSRLWNELRSVFENPKVPLPARTQVLEVALDKADASIAKESLSLFDTWIVEISLRDNDKPEPDANGKLTLLGIFVRQVGTDTWTQWFGSDPERLRFLERVIMHTGIASDVNREALNALAAGKSRTSERRAIAERIIAKRRTHTAHNSTLLGMLDASSFERLRALVREFNSPDGFHFGAAAVLAHFGDLESRGDLEARLAGFRKHHVNNEGMLVYYIWQIDVQTPPAKILEFIAEAPPPEVSVEKRMWAVRRAVELGLAKSKIRDAILKHASLVQPDKKTGIHRGLSSLKALCIDLKILDQSDLPDIRVAQGQATP